MLGYKEVWRDVPPERFYLVRLLLVASVMIDLHSHVHASWLCSLYCCTKIHAVEALELTYRACAKNLHSKITRHMHTWASPYKHANSLSTWHSCKSYTLCQKNAQSWTTCYVLGAMHSLNMHLEVGVAVQLCVTHRVLCRRMATGTMRAFTLVFAY